MMPTIPSVRRFRPFAANLAVTTVAARRQNHPPRPCLLMLLFLASGTACATPAAPNEPKTVIGRFELVVVRDVDMKLKARIDTGAAVSSINAKILEIKKTPDGERVVFQIKDHQGVSKTIEREIVGWNNIKVMGTNTKNRRPVVLMRICLGGKKLKGRMNLTDRSGFLYPALIGRNLLKTGKFLIDPREKYLVEPGCE